MMGNTQSAVSLMKDLRSVLDKRLSENEDYRGLKAIDKAILEVKIAIDVFEEEKHRHIGSQIGSSNPVADVQNQVAARFSA